MHGIESLEYLITTRCGPQTCFLLQRQYFNAVIFCFALERVKRLNHRRAQGGSRSWDLGGPQTSNYHLDSE